MRLIVLLAICLVPLSLGGALAQSLPQNPPPLAYAPVDLTGDPDTIAFPADYRLDFGSTGAVELGVTLPAADTAGYPQVMTILAHEGDGAAAFRVQIGGAGTRIGLYDGSRGSALPYDFRAGGFFQIGLSIREGQTEVFINGQRIGAMARGVGQGRGMPLYLGGQRDRRNSFLGLIHYIRLWDIDLRAQDYARTMAEYGSLPAGDPLLPQLVAYSQFTTQGASIAYTAPDPGLALLAGGVGNSTGQVFDLALPPDSVVTELFGSWDSHLREVGLVVRNRAGEEHILSAKGSEEAKPVTEACATPPCPVTMFQKRSAAMRFGPGGDAVVALEGTFDASQLYSLTFHLRSGESFTLGHPNDAATRQRVDLSPGTGFSGLRLLADAQINGAALGFALPVPPMDVHGRWVVTVDPLPHKRDDAAVRGADGISLYGDYSNQAVYSVVLRDNGQTVRLQGLGLATLEFRLGADGAYRDSAGQALQFPDENSMMVDDLLLQRVAPYPSISAEDSSFAAFGGTFDLDLQVPFTDHIFRGHEIGLIDPLNLQDPTPLRRPVFKAPAADSRDFYPSYQKIIPFGLLHYPDIREQERSLTEGFTSADDYTSSMSRNVGISIGIPKVFSFGLNASVAEQREEQASQQQQFSVTQDVRTERALVVDMRHIELDPAFEARILTMARDLKLGVPADYSTLILEYGTHFPYAMTVGTVSSKRLQFSLAAFSEMYAKQQSIEVTASATVRGVKAGAQGGQDSGNSSTLSKEMSEQKEALDAVGSELSPVPVFLDLRLLSDLLAPPFFDDPVILTQMRAGLEAAIKAHVANFPNKTLRPEDIYEPYFFKFGVQSVRYGVDISGGVIAPPPNTFSGKFTYLQPGQQNWADLETIPVRPGRDINLPYPVPPLERQMMLTASQICYQQANFYIGGAFSFDYSDDGSNLVNIGMRVANFYLPGMGSDRATQTLEVGFTQNQPDVLNVTFFLQRLPDMDGGFKELPTCQ
ncbi:MAC/perforin domain-containing protein [Tabrizicola fusiformis]|uniref:MAC/perforin domain-containing protein n=1 Tax=Tabrizicola sp. SY72 TaxID=2741673 RepID=UPI0015746601|nr:MAC/perforin domain-containing protein [Tabrizicola sp. SY72]NTT85471.1 hypothetical protein [Tabrizicola sp. SY72]